jgi:AcrR family transcriptional regulator
MNSWLADIQKVVGSGSKALADHFSMGDDWRNQQTFKTIFDKAYAASARELGIRDYWGDLPPFDEGEAVTMLCQNVLVKEFLPKVLEAVPRNAPCRWRLEWTAAGTLYALTGAAMSSAWIPAQAGIDQAKKGIAKVLDDGGQDLVDKLAPLLTKIFEIVESKMPKKDEKEEDAKEEEPAAVEIGSIVGAWKFEKTELGGKFYAGLIDKDARNAVSVLAQNWEQALGEALGKQMDDAVAGSCSPKFAKSGIVQLIVKEFGKYIAGTFREFTTVNPLIKASKAMDDKRWELEDALVKCAADRDAFTKAIDESSAEMWKQLPDAGLSLFKDLLDVKRKLFGYYNNLPYEAREALAVVSTHMFQIQMRALNALRADFTNRLKAKFADAANLASEDTIRATVRTLWRDIIFELILVMSKEGWTQTALGLIEVAVQNTLEYFFTNVWPVVVEPIKALAEMMPGPLAQLDVVALAETVVEKILTKGVTYTFTKVFLKLESILFKQQP